MDRNLKIARDLIRLARELVADDEKKNIGGQLKDLYQNRSDLNSNRNKRIKQVLPDIKGQLGNMKINDLIDFVGEVQDGIERMKNEDENAGGGNQ